MPDPSFSQSNTPEEALAKLYATAQALSTTKDLSPIAQKTLANLLDELGKAVASGKVSGEVVDHLAESVGQLNQALANQENPEHSKKARESLEESIFRAEAKHPYLAGMIQQLLNILADLGI